MYFNETNSFTSMNKFKIRVKEGEILLYFLAKYFELSIIYKLKFVSRFETK